MIQRKLTIDHRASKCLASRPVWDILEISRTDFVHQSMVISLLRVALRPIYSIHTLSGLHDNLEPLSEILAKQAPQSQAGDNNVASPLRSVDSSRSGFIACYFYLFVIMREDTVDPFVMNWFVEQLIADVCRTEALMRKGLYPQALWLWTVMFGACATTAARPISSLESEQVKAIRDAYLEKIKTACQVLQIQDWEGAKSALRLFAWAEDFDGEEELRALYEEAQWGNFDNQMQLHCSGNEFSPRIEITGF